MKTLKCCVMVMVVFTSTCGGARKWYTGKSDEMTVLAPAGSVL